MNSSMIFAMAGAAAAAFAIAALLGFVLIPLLRRLKFGQTIRDIGPAWHKNKQGIPTMGGFLFIIGLYCSLLILVPICQWGLVGKEVKVFASDRDNLRLVAGLLLMLGCAAIGFADDYIKVVRKRNLGLTERQKLLGQILVSGGYAVSMYLNGEHVQKIPFVGTVDIGFWFIPATMFIIIAYTNATNLTDGVDGLCGSVTVVAALPFLILAGYDGNMGQGLTAAAFCGGLLGYLVWNLHPAKIIMGDTGSLFVGGAMCALAFGSGRPLLLIPVGLIYIAEVLSVVLQVSYFKLTHGKRLFKMSPIHHHFEMSGWKENMIVAVFTGVTLIGSCAALLIELAQ